MKKDTTHNLTVAAMLSAVAFILMFIEFPIPMLIPDYTVGLGVSPSQHPIGVVAGYTAGGELHPALKRTFWHTV